MRSNEQQHSNQLGRDNIPELLRKAQQQNPAMCATKLLAAYGIVVSNNSDEKKAA